jgi:hypothetical protein
MMRITSDSSSGFTAISDSLRTTARWWDSRIGSLELAQHHPRPTSTYRKNRGGLITRRPKAWHPGGRRSGNTGGDGRNKPLQKQSINGTAWASAPSPSTRCARPSSSISSATARRCTRCANSPGTATSARRMGISRAATTTPRKPPATSRSACRLGRAINKSSGLHSSRPAQCQRLRSLRNCRLALPGMCWSRERTSCCRWHR